MEVPSRRATYRAVPQPLSPPTQTPRPDNFNAPATLGGPWDFLRGSVILLGFLALGEAAGPLLTHIGVPVPGSVVGLILLWTALRIGIVQASQITNAARPLITILPLLLVPAGVGVFVDGTLAGTKGLWYGGAVIALTIGSLVGVGLAAQAWLRRGK